jgi:dTDP-4-amino-4,6-dideoxygalactose transaminase
MREFGARQVGAYDPFRLVLWEDAAEALISEYRRDDYGSI